MKCNQFGRGFELVSPYPYPATITIAPRAHIVKAFINEFSFQYDLQTVNSSTCHHYAYVYIHSADVMLLSMYTKCSTILWSLPLEGKWLFVETHELSFISFHVEVNASRYLVGIRLELVYLREALNNLRCLQLLYFLSYISVFLAIFTVNTSSFIRSIDFLRMQSRQIINK